MACMSSPSLVFSCCSVGLQLQQPSSTFSWATTTSRRDISPTLSRSSCSSSSLPCLSPSLSSPSSSSFSLSSFPTTPNNNDADQQPPRSPFFSANSTSSGSNHTTSDVGNDPFFGLDLDIDLDPILYALPMTSAKLATPADDDLLSGRKSLDHLHHKPTYSTTATNNSGKTTTTTTTTTTVTSSTMDDVDALLLDAKKNAINSHVLANGSTLTRRTVTTTTSSSSSTTLVPENPTAQLGGPNHAPSLNLFFKIVNAVTWACYFDIGATVISVVQCFFLPLRFLGLSRVYHRVINWTEALFGELLLKMNQLYAPADLILTGDQSVCGLLKKRKDGSPIDFEAGEASFAYAKTDDVLLDMPERLVLIANHQIYSDWMYLWCFSYLAKMHSALKIILRGDLAWIPVFGWGMRFFDFILLKRNDWAHDRKAIEDNLERTPKDEPLWLVVFPEGTVVSKGTRQRSHAFAEKAGLKDHRHVLLPRTSGLFVCMNKLRGSVEYVYDLTVGYSGVARGEIPQELYPLPKLYIDQTQPQEIHVHMRRFRVADIPQDELAFVEWVRARWHEKDDLLDEFYTRGRFSSQLVSNKDKEGWAAALSSGKGIPAANKNKAVDMDKLLQDAQEGAIRIPFKSRAPLLDLFAPTRLHLALDLAVIVAAAAFVGYQYLSV